MDEKDKRIEELENMFKKLIRYFCEAIDTFLEKTKRE